MRSALVFGASLLFVSSLVAADARAFCRTTTEKEPGGYDPSRSGCFTSGTPLAWHASPVGYVFAEAASNQVKLADAQSAMAEAFGKWTSATCGTGTPAQHPSIATKDLGTVSSAATDCGLMQCDPTVHDSEHVIVFRDDAWPHNDPNNTLALTTVTFGVNSGEIFDADMEINTHDHVITTKTPTPSNAFDFEAIVTHEAGHFLGFAHSDDATAVMFVRYVSGRNQLGPDDVLGVCTVYAPGGNATSSKAGCACDVTGGGSGGVGACAAAVVGAALLRRRRRGRSSES